MRLMIDKLLKKDDANVIIVHWEQGARLPYSQAAGNSRLVGAQMEALLELLKGQFGLNYDRVHIIGSGLGAHVAGYAGRNIKRRSESIARITGMLNIAFEMSSKILFSVIQQCRGIIQLVQDLSYTTCG